MGRHRKPRRWGKTAAPAAVGLGTAAVALTASTAPDGLPIITSVETTTGSLPVVRPDLDPPTVVLLPRVDAAKVAAEALTAARRVTPTPTTLSRPSAEVSEVSPGISRRNDGAPGSRPSTGGLQERIVEAARGYVGKGIPYRYGGKACATYGPCDCSALVWVVLQDAGLDVTYRNSAALKQWAAPVSRPDAVPGDLVFFAYANGRVHHVGVYAGNNMLIDHGGPGRGANLRPIWGTPQFGRVPA